MYGIVSLLLLSTLSSSAAENRSLIERISLPNCIGTVCAIACLTDQNIVVGGENGAWNYSGAKKAYNKISEEQTFTIAPNEEQKLCLITNKKGLSIYNPTLNKVEWKKEDLATKKVSAIFGSRTTILVLDTLKQCLHVLDYEKNTEINYSLSCQQPYHNPSALLSCYTQNNAIKIAYLDQNQRASITEISNQCKKETIPHYDKRANMYMNEALLSPDGKKVVVINEAMGILIWDLEKKSYIIKGGNSTETFLIPFSCAFYSHNIVAILNLQQWLLEYYNIDTKKWLCKPQPLSLKNTDMTYIRRLSFSPDKKNIAVLANNAIFIVPVPQW